jgi:excisionase family DNA binding protein
VTLIGKEVNLSEGESMAKRCGSNLPPSQEVGTICLPGRKVFTVGQVVALCGVTPRTVRNWFDSGRLPGYRVPPITGDRRIPRESLIHFLRESEVPFIDLHPEWES